MTGYWLQSMRRTLRDLAETVIPAVLFYVLLMVTTQQYRIEGVSMGPTLLDGQRILVNKFVFAQNGNGGFVFHGPERGDIIVFDPPVSSPEDFIKRVIGIPGDEIDIRDGAVYVNGERAPDDYDYTTADANGYPRIVPEGEYFVMGDNRSRSNDSRAWGFVSADKIVGRTWFTYWPLSALRLWG